MAVFGSQWLVPAELVLHRTAVAFASPLYRKVLGLVTHPIWGSEFPLVFLSVRGRAGLVLVRLLAIASLVTILVLGHIGKNTGSSDGARGWHSLGNREALCE